MAWVIPEVGKPRKRRNVRPNRSVVIVWTSTAKIPAFLGR